MYVLLMLAQVPDANAAMNSKCIAISAQPCINTALGPPGVHYHGNFFGRLRKGQVFLTNPIKREIARFRTIPATKKHVFSLVVVRPLTATPVLTFIL